MWVLLFLIIQVENSCFGHAKKTDLDFGWGELEHSRWTNQEHAQSGAAQCGSARLGPVHT